MQILNQSNGEINDFFWEFDLGAAGVEVFDVVIDFLDEAGFRQSRTGGQLTLAFPLTENTSLSTRYSLRQEDIELPGTDCTQIDFSIPSQLTSLCEQVGGRLSSIFGYTFAWDRRNDPITPTRGFDVRFGQDIAGIGGDVKYLSCLLYTSDAADE